ncbi:MAG: WbuC family cupin fold metalloprotein [Gammaproteobacteria bacterium]|jgi:cupin fold WbuC family metalloprotein
MKIIDAQMILELTECAAESARQRCNHNLHPALSDPVQRFLNALQPDSYVRPHRHVDPPRWELFLILRGKAAILVFDESGGVQERIELVAGGSVSGIEIDPGRWHNLVALQAGTVVFELKQGPYAPMSDKDFAIWAPAEGRPETGRFLEWLREAQVGERPPGIR